MAVRAPRQSHAVSGLLALVRLGNGDPPEGICTIGYEGGTIDAFISALKQGGIELILDIRAGRQSRARKASRRISWRPAWWRPLFGYRHLRGSGPRSAGGIQRAVAISKTSRASFSLIWMSQKPCSISARQSRSPKTSRSACNVLTATRSTATGRCRKPHAGANRTGASPPVRGSRL